MRKLLCFIGWHSYGEWRVYSYTRCVSTCSCCGKDRFAISGW